MPNYNKQRGDRFERQVVSLLRNAGIEANRVPLSGALGGEYSGDIKSPRLGIIECKIRDSQRGYTQIIEWLGNNQLLFLGVDYGEPLVVMPWKVFKEKLNNGTELRTTLELEAIPESSTVNGHGDGI